MNSESYDHSYVVHAPRRQCLAPCRVTRREGGKEQ